MTFLNHKALSYALFWTLIAVLFMAKLIAPFLAGLAGYSLTVFLNKQLTKQLKREPGKISGLLVGALTILLLLGVYSSLNSLVLSVVSDLPAILTKAETVLTQLGQGLPSFIADKLPNTAGEMTHLMGQMAQEHMTKAASLGAQSMTLTFKIVAAIAIGTLIGMETVKPKAPFSANLCDRFEELAQSFIGLLKAQSTIALLNTAFTAMFLYGVLSPLGIEVPFKNFALAITLVTGILPVVGNVIANATLAVLAASVSPAAAVATVVFMILVHKSEYFINAKLIGKMSKAKVWEMLTAMIILESIFGVAGLILAPVLYSTLKLQLAKNRVIDTN